LIYRFVTSAFEFYSERRQEEHYRKITKNMLLEINLGIWLASPGRRSVQKIESKVKSVEAICERFL